MKRSILWLLRQMGSAVRILVIGALTVAMGAGAVYAANYALTQGSGTTFGSIVVSAVNYAQQLVCDQTTPAQCINVSAAGAAKTEGNGASGAALVGSPFRVGLSDGTNSQNWLAAIALGDGVNGNNSGAVVPWLFNGTTWDRARGDVGRTVTAPYAARADQVRGTTTSTDTGAHTIITAGAGSLKNYITDLECFRTDAGATAIVVTLSDAAATIVVVPGASSSGSGVVKSFLTPLATAAATAFTVTSATGVTTLYCSAQGFQAL